MEVCERKRQAIAEGRNPDDVVLVERRAEFLLHLMDKKKRKQIEDAKKAKGKGKKTEGCKEEKAPKKEEAKGSDNKRSHEEEKKKSVDKS